MSIPAANSSSTCPRCGGDNRCGIGTTEPCWCATEFAHRLPLPMSAGACYCRACVEALIAEQANNDDAN